MHISGLTAHDATAHVAKLGAELIAELLFVEIDEHGITAPMSRDARRRLSFHRVARDVDTIGVDDSHVDDARALLNIDPFIGDISQRR